MMTGLPGDTAEKDIETARKIIALEPDGVRIYPTVIVRDTVLYDMWRAGKYREHTVEDAVSVCAQLVPLFEAAGIPIIRLGLNPTDDLSGGDAAGGAYHPALGELVRSRIMLQKARELLDGITPGSTVTLAVGRGKASQMAGQHRCSTKALTEEFGLKNIRITEKTELSGQEIQILDIEMPREM